MKRISKILAILLTVTFILSACATNTQDKTGTKPQTTQLKVFNWGDYIDDSILKTFEDETGIKVVYSNYKDNEEMYEKLKNSNEDYDLCVPSDYMISKMINENMVQKIDLSKIPNYKYIEKKYIGAPFNDYDLSNSYSVPYMWGTIGIIYNTKKVTEPVDSWDILFNEKYKKQIFMSDDMRNSIGIALKLLGFSTNSTNPNELEKAKQLLIKQKSILRAYTGDEIKDKMKKNEGAIGVAYSGDAITMMDENEDLDYALPKEGTNVWVDSMVILKNSKNVDAAHKLINFMLRDDISKKNINYLNYATLHTEVYKQLDSAITQNIALYPDDAYLKKCEMYKDLGKDLETYSKIWTEIKAK